MDLRTLSSISLIAASLVACVTAQKAQADMFYVRVDQNIPVAYYLAESQGSPYLPAVGLTEGPASWPLSGPNARNFPEKTYRYGYVIQRYEYDAYPGGPEPVNGNLLYRSAPGPATGKRLLPQASCK